MDKALRERGLDFKYSGVDGSLVFDLVGEKVLLERWEHDWVAELETDELEVSLALSLKLEGLPEGLKPLEGEGKVTPGELSAPALEALLPSTEPRGLVSRLYALEARLKAPYGQRSYLADNSAKALRELLGEL